VAKLSRIAPEIPVSDLHAAIQYYEQKLGFRTVMEMPDRAYAILERDDVAVHLFRTDTRHYSPVAVHIFTNELEELHAELQQRGAGVLQGIVQKPWGNRDFRVSDGSGNEIKFTEPVSSLDENNAKGSKGGSDNDTSCRGQHVSIESV